MAAESINDALQALQDEMMWAGNLAKCLIAAMGDDQGERQPPWVNQFEHVIGRLDDRVQALCFAIKKPGVQLVKGGAQ